MKRSTTKQLIAAIARMPLAWATLLAFVITGYGVVRAFSPDELHATSTSRFDNVEISGTTDGTGIVTARAGVRLTTPTTGPIFISGSGVPASSATKGSLYLRTDTAQVYQNTDGATTWTQVGAPVTSGGSSIFGSGVDGVVTFDGRANPCDNATTTCASLASTTYTLTRNISPTNMSVAGGYTVKVAGFLFIGNGTISGTGTIQADGNAGTSGAGGGAGGTAPASGTLPGGAAGGAGAINSPSTPSQGTSTSSVPLWFTVANGGAAGQTTAGCANKNGGVGGIGKGGGGGARCKSYANGPAPGARGGDISTQSGDSVFTQSMISGRPVGNPTSTFGASTGGGGGAASDAYNDSPAGQNLRGGGGGSSAGWVVVVFKTWSFTGTISAKGGAGGVGTSVNTGGSGGTGSCGGGGGAGGTIVLVRASGSFPTTDITGGAGAAGGTFTGGSVDNDTGGSGGNGGVGYVNLISAN